MRLSNATSSWACPRTGRALRAFALTCAAGITLGLTTPAHATNFAILFTGGGGGDDETCHLTRDTLSLQSMTFTTQNNRKLSKNKDTDGYSPWDIDDADDGTVVNPLFEASGTNGVNPLYEGSHDLLVSVQPTEMQVFPNDARTAWRVAISCDFIFRPAGIADPEWELVVTKVGFCEIPASAMDLSSGLPADTDSLLPGLRTLIYGEEGMRIRNRRTLMEEPTPYVMAGATWDLQIVIPAPSAAAGLGLGALVAFRRRRA